MPSSGFLLRRNMVPRLGAVRNRELSAGRNGSVTAPDRFPVNGFGRRARRPGREGIVFAPLGLGKIERVGRRLGGGRGGEAR
jgi:hypothetical protein